MKFSTHSQRQLAKMALKATAMYPDGVPAHSLVDNARQKELYKRAGSASNQLKEMVADDNFPLKRKGNRLIRTDMEEAAT